LWTSFEPTSKQASHGLCEATVTNRRRALPQSFLDSARALEQSYLETDDPVRQSGFGGGAKRWRAEREPILDAVEHDGDILDIGCANGHLLECLVSWGRERGLNLTPHGLDLGPRLIDLARLRHPNFAENFHVGNAWDWRPPRRYRYVYMLYDCVPEAYLAECFGRLLAVFIEPGGRLIVGAYGPKTRGVPPFDIAAFIRDAGLTVAGTSGDADPPVAAAFAWVDA
jgi:SAM-dependent methyltransferase|tara:strand:- start:4484 stop:5161 length:678 start_codon:yes stop_codon:yes gene_type:complete